MIPPILSSTCLATLGDEIERLADERRRARERSREVLDRATAMREPADGASMLDLKRAGARLRADAARATADRAELRARGLELSTLYWEPQCHLPGCPCNGTDLEVTR